MGLFVKKINQEKAVNFFEEFYSSFNAHEEIQDHKDQLQKLKDNFEEFDRVKQSDFNDNLDAANIELMDIAWTKFLNKKRMDLMANVDFKIKYIDPIKKKYGLDKLDSLESMYNQAFGSSYQDGNTAMAIVFMQQVIPNYDDLLEAAPDQLQQTTLFISQQFANTYLANYQIIKHGGLVV